MLVPSNIPNEMCFVEHLRGVHSGVVCARAAIGDRRGEERTGNGAAVWAGAGEGPVFHVSGCWHAPAEDVAMQVVARDGLDPPPPAFSGPLIDIAKWFRISINYTLTNT